MKGKLPTDVVSREYAQSYAQEQFKHLPEGEREVSLVEERMGRSLAGTKVLDLCGGPGQFSVLMAQKGAEVTWHDPSPSYLEIAQEKCKEFGVGVEFKLGGFDALSIYDDSSFDLVFNRVSWYYSDHEWRTFREVTRVLRPAGFFWLHTHNRKFIDGITSPIVKPIHLFCFHLHELVGIKLCHVPASSKRLQKWLFGKGLFRCLFADEAGKNFRFLAQKQPVATAPL